MASSAFSENMDSKTEKKLQIKMDPND